MSETVSTLLAEASAAWQRGHAATALAYARDAVARMETARKRKFDRELLCAGLCEIAGVSHPWDPDRQSGE